MSFAGIQDFSYRLDHSENMVVNTNYAYIKGIVAMMFGVRPGADSYNPEMGLDLPGKRYTASKNNTRDTQYETEISKQFAKYTDILALNPIALRSNGRYLVSFTASYRSKLYQINAGVNDNTLTVAINAQNSGVNLL